MNYNTFTNYWLNKLSIDKYHDTNLKQFKSQTLFKRTVKSFKYHHLKIKHLLRTFRTKNICSEKGDSYALSLGKRYNYFNDI